jgi:hypothetical protein
MLAPKYKRVRRRWGALEIASLAIQEVLRLHPDIPADISTRQLFLNYLDPWRRESGQRPFYQKTVGRARVELRKRGVQI